MSAPGCDHDQWFNSKKGGTTITLSLTISGTSTDVATGPFGYTNSKNVSSTTRTITFTRKEFKARTDCPNGTFILDNLEPDEFWLVGKCCCWKCRFAVISHGIESHDFSFTVDYDFTPTDGEHTSGSFDINQFAGFQTTVPEARSFYCQSDGEEDKIAQRALLSATADDMFFLPSANDWTYSDSNGTSASGSGYAGDFAVVGPATAYASGVPFTSVCSDTPSAWVEMNFTGSTVVPYGDPEDGYTQTTTANVTVRAEIAIS